MAKREHPNLTWEQRAQAIISMSVPTPYQYLITSELVEEGADLLRRGKGFRVQVDTDRLGPGFDVAMSHTAGQLPGVTGDGISARGLITLVPTAK